MTSSFRYWTMSFTLIVATAGFHFLPHGHDVSLPKPLTSLPLSLGPWRGVETPFDESVVRAVAVDDYLSRVYRGTDGEPLGLYIGYYKSQRTDDTIHSPQNCLPGTGWQPLKSRYILVAITEGREVKFHEYIVQKGLDLQLILYWYQSHGRTIASEYQAKIALVVDAIYLHRTDSALVRINTPFTGKSPEDRAVAFATALLGQLDGIIPK